VNPHEPDFRVMVSWFPIIHMQIKKTRILIVGGGFGGVYTAMWLEKLLKNDAEIGRAHV